ncbi:Ubiquitin-like modifier-activating enzyme ATG7, partial [Acropora cervicornis]
IWESILSGQAVDDPSLLCKFVLITFADLKHYKFYYWFAFPALCPEVNAVNVDSPVALGNYFSALQYDINK